MAESAVVRVAEEFRKSTWTLPIWIASKKQTAKDSIPQYCNIASA